MIGFVRGRRKPCAGEESLVTLRKGEPVPRGVEASCPSPPLSRIWLIIDGQLLTLEALHNSPCCTLTHVYYSFECCDPESETLAAMAHSRSLFRD
jgi:hypothetical protein